MTAPLLSVVLVTLAPAPGHTECSLRGASGPAGLPLGAATGPSQLANDPQYGPTLGAHFGSLTAENVMKWRATQPQRGVYDFANADALVAFADANAMAVRGHTLIWEQENLDSTPDWVIAITDPDELRAVMTDHIQTVVSRYAGRIDAWDVVNEPLVTIGDQIYENHFHQVLGPGYLREALEIAHAADPTALLFINDVLVANPGPKLSALVALTEDLLAQGAPLHGVGVQGHFLFPPNGAALQQSMEALAATGVVVELTEVDILLRGPGDEPTRLARQADDYLGVVSACLAVPACQRVTFWGFTDRYTWIDGFVGPGFAPLPFDADYGRKPAYYAIRQALDAASGANRPVNGRRLSIRGGSATAKLVLRSRDEAIAPSFTDAGADPTQAGATLRIVNASTGAEGVVELEPGGWRALGSPRGSRGYRYSNPGGAPCRRAVVRAGTLRVSCRDSEILPLAGVAQGTLAATVRLGCGAVHCMEFGGTVVADEGSAATARTRFLAKNAPAPATCASQY